MTATARLDIRHLTLAHDGQPPIAADWSATIEPGVTLLHGDTGSGKTSLLRVLAGDDPARGDVVLNGASSSQDREAYRRQVFYVEPWTDRYDAMKPLACAQALSEGRGIDEPLWNELVERFSLVPHLDKSLFMLSTGSKRKVWLASALVSSLPLVLLDEPTAALDAASIKALWAALKQAAHTPSRIFVVASSEVPADLVATRRIDLPLA